MTEITELSNIAETNETRTSQNHKNESDTISEIVVSEGSSEQPNNEEILIISTIEDATSTSSNDFDDEDDSHSETKHGIVAHDEYGGSNRNIVVKNSSDVHFGNKTHYQYEGPVTVKQYTHGTEGEGNRKLAIGNGGESNSAFDQSDENRGQENFAFEPETVIHKDEESNNRVENHIGQNIFNEDNENNTKTTKGTNWLNNIRNKQKQLAIYLLIVFVIVIIIIIVSLIIKKNYVTNPSWRKDSNINGPLTIIHRNEWLAKLPQYSLAPLTLPAPNIIIIHTVTRSCTNRGECVDIVRYIQRHHMDDRRLSDITYNFLVGGDGYIYEGRGWDKVGEYTLKWNNKSIGIAFIGTFEDILPPEHQMSAGKMLIEFGVKSNYIEQDYKLYGHLQMINNTRSPGEVFFKDIKTWPHWTNRSYTGT